MRSQTLINPYISFTRGLKVVLTLNPHLCKIHNLDDVKHIFSPDLNLSRSQLNNSKTVHGIRTTTVKLDFRAAMMNFEGYLRNNFPTHVKSAIDRNWQGIIKNASENY